MDFINHSALHLGSKQFTFDKAKILRNNLTAAESLLWNALRGNRLNGYKFRRQHPIKGYIADFYCHEAKLVVEVDGEIHNEIVVHEHDESRSSELKEFNVKVIRFTNDEVLNSLDKVLLRINMEIEQSISEQKS